MFFGAYQDASNVYIYDDKTGFTVGPALPDTNRIHHATAAPIGVDEMFVSNIYTAYTMPINCGEKETIFIPEDELRPNNEVWSAGTTGIVYDMEGNPKYLVLVGESSRSRVRKMDINTREWSYAPDFPIPRARLMQSVQFGRSFVVLGGSFGSYPNFFSNNEIFMIDPDTLEWSKLNSTLGQGRHYFFAAAISDDIVMCN